MRKLFLAFLALLTFASVSNAAFMTDPWILQGGNIFGDDIKIGSLDSFDVNFITNDIQRMSILTGIDNEVVVGRTSQNSSLTILSGSTTNNSSLKLSAGIKDTFFGTWSTGQVSIFLPPTSYFNMGFAGGNTYVFSIFGDGVVYHRTPALEVSGVSSGAPAIFQLEDYNDTTKAQFVYDTNIFLNYTNDLVFQSTLDTEVARFTSGGKFGFGSSNPQFGFTISGEKDVSIEISPPPKPSVLASAGGSCPTGTYYYKVVALDGSYVPGTTTPSVESNSVGVTGPNGSVIVYNYAVSYAYGYRIYRGTTPGGENVWYTSFSSIFTDTCASGTSGAPPSVNTSSNIRLDPNSVSWIRGSLGLGHAIPGAALHIGNRNYEVYGNTGFIRMDGVVGDPSSPIPGDFWYDVTSRAHYFQNVVGTVGLSGVLYTNTANSAAVANTTSETLFNKNYTLPSNSLTVEKTIRITAGGKYSTTLAPGIQFRAKIGSSVACDSEVFGTMSGASNRAWWTDCTIIIRSVGAGGTGSANGFVGARTASIINNAQTFLPVTNNGTFVINTTTTNVVGVSVQWVVANPANTATLENIVVEVLK